MKDLIDKIEIRFDDLLFQTIRGNLTHAQIENGTRYDQFEQVSEWKSKYGFKFNIYSNDHLINGKKHFHFDNLPQGISAKIDFDGNLLESSGKPIPSNILKDLKYFLSKGYNKENLNQMWDIKNPE